MEAPPKFKILSCRPPDEIPRQLYGGNGGGGNNGNLDGGLQNITVARWR